MTSNPTWVPVVAAAIVDEIGRVLLQLRLPDKHHGGTWEFPGGKVQANENPRLALVREIDEELGLALDPDQLTPALMADEGACPTIVLFLYILRQWQGAPMGKDGQQWGWFTLTEAAELALAPMDRDLLARLVL